MGTTLPCCPQSHRPHHHRSGQSIWYLSWSIQFVGDTDRSRGCDDDAGEIGGIDRPFAPTPEHRMAGHLAAGMADANQPVRLLDYDLGADEPLPASRQGLLGAKTAKRQPRSRLKGPSLAFRQAPVNQFQFRGSAGERNFTALPTLDCPYAHGKPQGRRLQRPPAGLRALTLPVRSGWQITGDGTKNGSSGFEQRTRAREGAAVCGRVPSCLSYIWI